MNKIPNFDGPKHQQHLFRKSKKRKESFLMTFDKNKIFPL